MPPYAHTAPEGPWEPLFTEFGEGEGQCQRERCKKCEALDRYHGHLNKAAWWAAKFASEMFPPGPDRDAAWLWGYLAGLWHDLGKFPEKWQLYLQSKADIHLAEIVGSTDHSTAGAKHAVLSVPLFGHLLAYAIAGHHSGLLDTISPNACQEKRLKDCIPDLANVPASVLEATPLHLPPTIARAATPSSLATFTRMIFSCLVDADFLATESFMNPEQAKHRPDSEGALLPRMLERLEEKMKSFGTPQGVVAVARESVYRQCMEAAPLNPGLFSLTVPTGGGKTLSSLAFALRHAIAHGMKRVIYVIPFTSIIEQNASVFEEIFAPLVGPDGSPVVLEHHSNLSPDKETLRSRLAAENWDAPLIVTTAVQFYESLHAARTSTCRKLHHIANSVVILDEAQCLPVDYLQPCLHMLEQLTDSYRTSVVLCTATQPAIHAREGFPIGLKNIRPIIADPVTLYKNLERVRVIRRGPLNDLTLSQEVAALEQVLVIVNTRRHARELFRLLADAPENFHLSALMCPEHRCAVLAEVRQRLQDGLPVRLVSTQLIEAGVDVDFPVVYRSLAGIDSIAQAAGRCNRNGKMPIGYVHVFHSEHQRAEAYFRDTTQVTESVIELHEDILSLDSVETFFNLYYLGHHPPEGERWDSKGLQKECGTTGDRNLPFRLQFKTIADRFRLIENDQVPVIVPYDEKAKRLVGLLGNESIPLHRHLLRSLQRYTVQVRRREFQHHAFQFESVRDDQFHILICPESHYSETFGLNLESSSEALLIA